MPHYTEHILELYVQNSAEVLERRTEIEHHLAECYSCRELVQEMRDFYIQTEDAKKLLAGQSDESTSLVMEAHIEKRHISSVYIPNSLPVRLIRFIRQQPVKSSLFTMGIFLLGIFSINTIQKKNGSKPLYYEYNTSNNSIEVYDKNDTKLWEKRLKGDAAAMKNKETVNAFHQLLVADIDHDGNNEVIILPALAVDQLVAPNLKIFDHNGDLRIKNLLPFQKIRYKTKKYETEFIPTSVIYGGDKQKNLFVGFQNGRSPSIIVRYDEKGNIIGTFWHYGQLTNMMFFDVNHDGTNELVLNGINDTEDETARSYAVTVIVDPDKIVGDCESSATKGFGFTSSVAETYYIRYPNPEIILLSSINLFAKNELYREGDKIFRVLTEAMVKTTEVAIEYYFDSTVAVTDAKFAGQTLIHHNQLYKEGKLKQPINDEYIKSLKDGVLYWNGSNWVDKAVRIGGQISLK